MLMGVFFFVFVFLRRPWPSKSRVTVVTVFVPISFDFSALSGILHLLQHFFFCSCWRGSVFDVGMCFEPSALFSPL